MQQLLNRPWYKFYTSTQKDLQVPVVSLYSIFEDTVKRYGERTAIIHEHRKITYSEVKDRVDRVAAAWTELGAQKGERIGLMLTNHPDYITSYYAAQALGLIVVQINPMYTPRELLQIVKDSQIAYLVAERSALKTVDQIGDSYGFKHIFVSQLGIGEQNSILKNLDDLNVYKNHLKEPTHISPQEDIAVIQYTGGTTGKMKGVMLTHYNLIANVIQSKSLYGDQMVHGKEIFLTVTPLYHVLGMTNAMNLGIYIGGTLLLVKKFETEQVLELIREYQPTFFPGVPKMYNAFVNHPNVENYGLDCIKFCTSGSAPLPSEIIKRFEQLTGSYIAEGFGLSEASPLTHRNPTNIKKKLGSIGIPVPGTDSIVVDNHNKELPVGSVGELLIKGPQVMKGYWNNETETNQSLKDGWLHTGDLAKMDEEGYFYIVGRQKEMIIVGGFNIYPQEIENVLYEHPDVKEVAVVGIPNQEHEEIVKAYIVPKEGCQINLERLKEYCYLKITRYKVPKVFEIRDSLPRNTVGKLLKRVLVQEELEKRATNTTHS
ncbi:long-chain-fatty-acid--CoA ligase [Bacillus dakarensis]|uniref:long-chain-fatty-acid--CoA ligase n=1 Tax=Robertmurraya dakarensis TaxID=1926278 RepID=UPI000980BC5B|nr:long-chain fatty acid--CoA ligase [Bacillus dakarensis]